MDCKTFIFATALEFFALPASARDAVPAQDFSTTPKGIAVVSIAVESRNAFDKSLIGKGTNSFNLNQGFVEPPFTCPQLKIIDEDDLFDELEDCD